MSNTISPLRRIAVTLAMTGVTAFGAVAIAPAAFADDAVAVQPAPAVTAPVVVPAPAVTDPAVVPAPAPAPAVVTPPAPPAPPVIVYDKNGKPIKEPKVCTAKDLSDTAKKVADATKKAAPQFLLASKSHDAADLVRAQEPKLTVSQVKLAELVANGLDSIGDKLAAQAQASIDSAGLLSCIIVVSPGGRF